MPLIRNAYAKTLVNVAGVSIPPLKTRDIPTNHWNTWMEHSGNKELAAKYLTIVQGNEDIDIQLPDRAAAQAAAGDPAPDTAGTDPVGTDPAAAQELPVDNSGQARELVIDAAVKALMESGGPEDLTQQGKPRMPAVKARTGLTDVTVEEVTAAVYRYDEQRNSA